VSPVLIVLFASSALFAWSMGSHYTGAVVGTAYGSGILSIGRAQLVAATAAFVGSAVASVDVIDTYAHGLVTRSSPIDISAALLAAAIVTTISTYFRLPTSTIQIYTFSLLGAAIAGGLPIRLAGFGLVIVFWALGPLVGFVLGYLLARLGINVARRGQQALTWFVVGVSLYSSFTLGSNDVSNAVASLVMLNLLSPHLAGLYGGIFMALGVLTWGRGLCERIGRGILPLDVPLAASAQLSQAFAMTIINRVGFNASINQTIVGGLTGVGTAVAPEKLNRRAIRNIALNWTWSPILGLSSAALASVVFHAVFGR